MRPSISTRTETPCNPPDTLIQSSTHERGAYVAFSTLTQSTDACLYFVTLTPRAWPCGANIRLTLGQRGFQRMALIRQRQYL